MRSCLALLVALTATPFAAAHFKITAAKGNLGGNGVALGLTPGSDDQERDDVTRFNGRQADTFGRTRAVSAFSSIFTSLSFLLLAIC